MEKYMDNILRDGDIIKESIDLTALHRYTHRVPFSYVIEKQWDGLRQLSILGADQYLNSGQFVYFTEAGCYVNEDEDWLLIIGAAKDQIEQIIARCSSRLEVLDLRFTNLDGISISHLTGLRKMKLLKNPTLYQIKGLPQLQKMEIIDMYQSSVGQRLNISFMKNLRELKLRYIKGLNYLEGLEQLAEIRSLHVVSTPIEGMLNLNGMTLLRELRLYDTRIEKILLDHSLPSVQRIHSGHCKFSEVDFLGYLPELEELDLEVCAVRELPSLAHCAKLKNVSLWGMEIKALDHLPVGIEVLRLVSLEIDKLPTCIRDMSKLKRLILRNLHLDGLPVWLADLGIPVYPYHSNEENGVFISRVRVEGIDMSSFPRYQSLVRDWLVAQQDGDCGTEKPLNEIKVVFLGDGEAGKSLLVQRLINDGKMIEDYDGDTTPGVQIDHKLLEFDDRVVKAHYWDFGGQEILHAMHRIFMTRRTLYVVVLNSRNDTQDERARFWLRYIHSFDDEARVLLVLNKIDQNPRASLNETELREQYPDLPEVVKISATKASQEEFREKLIGAIQAQISRFESLRMVLPAPWRSVKLQMEGMAKNYIRMAQFDHICDSSKMDRDKEKRSALQDLLNQLGVTFRCGDRRTGSYVLLRPEWVTNAIYMILFNKQAGVKNGIISYDQILECLQQNTENCEKHWQVSDDMSYDDDEVAYILKVMQTHQLSFDMGDGNEFIPMLCERNASLLATKYANDPDTVEIWWQFDYLPDSLLFRLMVERKDELDTDHVWLSGAMFCEKKTGCSAIVRRDGNILKIYVQSDDLRFPAGGYRKTLEDSIQHIIRRDFRGLQKETQRRFDFHASTGAEEDEYPAANRLLVYKANGKREIFDCRRLEMGRFKQVNQHYSKILDASISTDDILNQAYDGTDPVRGLLIRDVLSACTAIQQDHIYWDGKEGSRENSRNTQVRTILRQKNYVANDQTLCGISEGRNQEGELDIEIRKIPNTPWTIFEALNLSSVNLNYWNGHLDKLLDNYNPHGLKFLFLVSYVKCSREKFQEIWAAYESHIPTYNPGRYRCIAASYMTLSERYLQNVDLIRGAQCAYDCGGSRTTVYHIFVHLGEKQ